MLPVGEAAIEFCEATELRRLYGELPDAAAAARKALKSDNGEPLTGDKLRLLRESNARIVAIVDRLKAILGR